jgi:hypothetical protein
MQSPIATMRAAAWRASRADRATRGWPSGAGAEGGGLDAGSSTRARSHPASAASIRAVRIESPTTAIDPDLTAARRPIRDPQGSGCPPAQSHLDHVAQLGLAAAREVGRERGFEPVSLAHGRDPVSVVRGWRGGRRQAMSALRERHVACPPPGHEEARRCAAPRDSRLALSRVLLLGLRAPLTDRR